MRNLFAIALLVCFGPTYAATLISVGTFGSASDTYDGYFYSDGDEDDGTGNININDAAISGLTRFDPALGTLTGISIAASFTVDVEVAVSVLEPIDPGQDHAAGFVMTDGGFGNGVGAWLRYHSPSEPGFTRNLLNQEFDISVSCNGAGFEGCANVVTGEIVFTQSGNVFDNANTFRNLLPGDYLGNGALGGTFSAASVFYQGQLWDPGVTTFNVFEAEGSVGAVINPGTVTLTYTYTPVPLPPALLLFGGALVFLGRRLGNA